MNKRACLLLDFLNLGGINSEVRGIKLCLASTPKSAYFFYYFSLSFSTPFCRLMKMALLRGVNPPLQLRLGLITISFTKVALPSLPTSLPTNPSRRCRYHRCLCDVYAQASSLRSDVSKSLPPGSIHNTQGDLSIFLCGVPPRLVASRDSVTTAAAASPRRSLHHFERPPQQISNGTKCSATGSKSELVARFRKCPYFHI
jgi:hypothetical protein